MKLSVFLPLAIITGLAAAESQKALRWTFEDPPEGKLPEAWTTAKTGKGRGSVWKIVADDSAPSGRQVMAQTSSEGPTPLFNLCVADETNYADVELRVAFKAVSGKKDQGGGVVWRYKDANNYYIARMNPLEANFRVYKVVGGKRTQLDTADTEAEAGKWHTIRIVHKGDSIQCSFNDKPYLKAKDDTFSEAGKIGLWTKADAVTHFDDLQVSVPAP
jgi:hypothetical protein